MTTEANEVEQALLAEVREARAERDLAVAEARAERDAAYGEAREARAERDGAVARERAALAEAARLEERHVERDVDELVGVKILPVQRDEFVALRKWSRERFDSIVATLPKLRLLERVVPDAPIVDRSPDGGDAILKLLEQDDF